MASSFPYTISGHKHPCALSEGLPVLQMSQALKTSMSLSALGVSGSGRGFCREQPPLPPQPSACPLPSDPCAVPIATYGCRIKQACWHLCVCHCDDSVAGNLSHSECTCENPNLCMLAFIRITFQGSQFNYQGEVTVLWVQRPFVHAELHHFLTFFASDVTELQESAISSLSPPSGALFFFSCYSGDPLVFLGISIYSFPEKYLWKYAKETLHKPSRCIMWRHLAVIKWGDYSKAHHFPLLFTSSWFFDLLVYTL